MASRSLDLMEIACYSGRRLGVMRQARSGSISRSIAVAVVMKTSTLLRMYEAGERDFAGVDLWRVPIYKA